VNTSKTPSVVLVLSLTDSQAMALAQFVKRVGWSEFRSNAVGDDEAYVIRDAFDALRLELCVHGYSPR
jgi:hypothetical protein